MRLLSSAFWREFQLRKRKKKKGKMINREKEEHLIERWADNRLEQKQNTGIVGSKWHAKMSRNVSVSLVSAVYKTSLFVEHNFFPNFENGILKKRSTWDAQWFTKKSWKQTITKQSTLNNNKQIQWINGQLKNRTALTQIQKNEKETN